MSDTIIDVQDVTKMYEHTAGLSTVAIEEVSLEIERGSVVSFLGPNGAGKSTLLKCILGLIEPTFGRVLIDGVDVAENPTDVYGEVSFVAEGARNIYWRLTVWENVRLFSGLHGIDYRDNRENIEEYLDLFELDDMRDEPVRNLSRGQKQRCYLVCALARESDILILDEPTLGLDLGTSKKLMKSFRYLAEEQGRTILLGSHAMNLVESASDRVVILDDGEVVVDDDVENLLELFSTDAFDIVVDGEVSPSLRRRLYEEFTVEWWDGGTDVTSFRATVFSDEELYALIGLLQSAGKTLVSVERDQPNIEEVYLQVAQEGAP
jgi:ABC-2 type transport system ATP-binding protein